MSLAVLLALAALSGSGSAFHDGQAQEIETYRSSEEPYDVFDDAVVSFMEQHGIHAASFALSYEDDLLWSQGYGTMERGGIAQVPPDSLFRLASISKPITAAAIYQLSNTGQLTLSDKVFCLGDDRPSTVSIPFTSRCHLDLEPPEGADVDSRLARIDIGHLLEHRAGWDRDVSRDWMFEEIEIAQALEVQSPPSREQVARFMLGQPLDFDPGDRRAYSNLGYMLLGLIIERVTGQPYVDVVHDRVFLRADADEQDVHMGNTLPGNRDAREPDYHCFGETRNVFDPDRDACWPDGGFHVQGLHSAGGLIASAPTMAWFLDHYWLDGQPRLPGTAEIDSRHYWFFGSLPGTFTLARQLPDGLNMVLLLNQRWHEGQGAQGYPEVKGLLDTAAEEYRAERGSPLPPNLDDDVGGIPSIGPQDQAGPLDGLVGPRSWSNVAG